MTDETTPAERVTYPPGFYPDMPLEHYFADPAESEFGSLNSSGIPTLRKKSPLHFATLSPVLTARYNLVPNERTDNAASRRGNVVHRMALGKGSDYEVGDYNDFKTNAAKEWRDDLEARGMVALLQKDVADATRQSDLLRHHLDQLFMGEEWLPEVALLWTEDTPWGPVNCRALVDAWCPKLIHGADLKSTTDASDENVTKQCERMGYDVQDAWYSRGLTRALGLVPGTVQFSILFGETKPPYASQAFQLPNSWHDSAWNECELAVRTFAQCQNGDLFPGYPVRARQLVMPPWLNVRRMERELQVDDLNDDHGLLDTTAMPPPDFDDEGEG